MLVWPRKVVSNEEHLPQETRLLSCFPASKRVLKLRSIRSCRSNYLRRWGRPIDSHRERDFNDFPSPNTCANSLFETAVIELNKELGESKSADGVIKDGFKRYRDLIELQIDTYQPDVIITCLPEGLKEIVVDLYDHCHTGVLDNNKLSNVIIGGSDVAVSKKVEPVFIWAYHPAATSGLYGEGISNQDYTESILRAYDNALEHNLANA